MLNGRSLMRRGGHALLLFFCAAYCGVAGAADFAVREVFETGRGVFVRALKLDPGAGSMWVGTSTGVMEIDLATLQPRRTFTRKDGLANEYVFAVGIDRDGYKWFGTNAGGVSRYKAGQWRTFFPMHGLADYWVYAFANQRNGTLWIGTWAGANSYDLRTGKFRTYVKELINEWVYGVAVDAADRVWFGTEGGVTMYDGRQWKSWTHRDGLGAPNTDRLPASANTGLGTKKRHDLATTAGGKPTYNPNYVFAIHVARDGSVWAGTWGGGAARYRDGRWSNVTTRDGLAGNLVFAIAEAPDGALWFGTDQGVSRFDGKRWSSLAVRDGLPDANVYALAVTPGGEVWAGARGGVARIGRR